MIYEKDLEQITQEVTPDSTIDEVRAKITDGTKEAKEFKGLLHKLKTETSSQLSHRSTLSEVGQYFTNLDNIAKFSRLGSNDTIKAESARDSYRYVLGEFLDKLQIPHRLGLQNITVEELLQCKIENVSTLLEIGDINLAPTYKDILYKTREPGFEWYVLVRALRTISRHRARLQISTLGDFIQKAKTDYLFGLQVLDLPNMDSSREGKQEGFKAINRFVDALGIGTHKLNFLNLEINQNLPKDLPLNIAQLLFPKVLSSDEQKTINAALVGLNRSLKGSNIPVDSLSLHDLGYIISDNNFETRNVDKIKSFGPKAKQVFIKIFELIGVKHHLTIDES